MEFLIGFNPGAKPIHISGGMLIIKRLVELLTEKNQTVYVLNRQYKTEKAILLDGLGLSNLDKNKVIVIYPEIISGNPFDMKNVVRWILYDTNVAIENTWSETDVYFYYNNLFKTHKKTKEDKKILNCFYFNLDKLYDMNLKRDGYCHINKHPRGVLKNETIEQYNSEEITEGFNKFGYDWLREKFNQKEFFITNDAATYYSAMAALCGCKSIILDKKLSLEERENLITHKYGVAFGFEEIENAKDSLHLLRPHLEDNERKSYIKVDNFIEFWKKK
jgi:hypothetical protein